MTHHLPKKRLVFIFIEGLEEPLKGMVKVSSPRSLDNAIREAYDLEPTVKSLKGRSGSKGFISRKLFLEGPSNSKVAPPSKPEQLDAATRRWLREEGKCFSCKKPWEPEHHCLEKGQAHYIEVCSGGESDDSDLEMGADICGLGSPRVAGTLGSMIASLHGVKKYLTLKVIGQARGQDVMVLIDLGTSYNFVDASFVEKKRMRTKAFEGFRVSNANGELTLVDHIVEWFGVRLQSCVVREEFYLYPLKGHPHIILGVQWLFDLGDIHTNYQKLTMSFEIDGKTHTLQSIRDNCPQVDSKRLEMIEWC